MREAKVTLHDGARVAIIGGGPAGSFFGIFASKLARDMGKTLDLTIYERKSFFTHGATGCNMCAGVISESLVQTLALEGNNLPSTVVQWGIESYFFHTLDGSVEIKSSRLRQRGIATVFRGSGPAGSLAKHQSRDLCSCRALCERRGNLRSAAAARAPWFRFR